MPTLKDIVAYCDKRTRLAAFKDAPGSFNGLQLENDCLLYTSRCV